ncbi:Zinc knuckle [Popillia japonica]|uniref:Zinc knuckle n=1 Tax=Popillia japonica TaxID=7064 RepID=A0AAW1IWX9_POPJA
MVITKIITSLPDMYKHFVSAWDSVQSEKQTLSELTARLLIEEQRTNNRQEVTALLSKQKEEKRKCFKCGKIGHYKKDCGNNNFKKYCEHCKKKGHNKKDCWFLNKKKENTNESASNAFSAIGDGQITNDWIVDSGASDHMCHNQNFFSEYKLVFK